jgi:hypothetical protein
MYGHYHEGKPKKDRNRQSTANQIKTDKNKKAIKVCKSELLITSVILSF